MIGEDSSHLADIASAFERSPFVLFLGAGVNGSLSPQWSGVLRTLQDIAFGHVAPSLPWVSRKKFRKYCNSLSYETQAEICKLLLDAAYEPHLKRCIYSAPAKRRTHGPIPGKRFDRGALDKYIKSPTSKGRSARKYELLSHVARLSQHPNVAAVLTLNYDNYLEMSIESLIESRSKKGGISPPRKPHSVPGSGRYVAPNYSSLPIHHIHGFLPYPTPTLPEDSEDIVLSQDEYIAAFNAGNDVTSSTAIHYLANYPALFIGLSMCDWNLLRMLRASMRGNRSHTHFCLMKSDGELDRIRVSLLERYGVSVVLCHPEKSDSSDSFAAVRRVTQHLCQTLETGGPHAKQPRAPE